MSSLAVYQSLWCPASVRRGREKGPATRTESWRNPAGTTPCREPSPPTCARPGPPAHKASALPAANGAGGHTGRRRSSARARAQRAGVRALDESLKALGFGSKPRWEHQYLQQSNEVNALYGVKDHVWQTDGGDSTGFGVAPQFGCCTANMQQGWSVPPPTPRAAAAALRCACETPRRRILIL